ncbi:MAG: hypothetical protein RLZZ197_1278 [Bacteroidota bacterium]
MHLKSLQVNQFKSYEEARFSFISEINCIVGENGIGKTNLLDAIHFLSMTKSSRGIVQGDFVDTQDRETQITCVFQKGAKKQFLRDDKPYPRLADHIGHFPVVLMDPHDTDLVREGSEERRRFFDGMMSQLDRNFLDQLLRYNRIVQQRKQNPAGNF